MKNGFYLVTILSLLVACNHPGKELKQRLIDSDSMAVNFFSGDGTMDTVVSTRIIRDNKIMNELAEFIAGRRIKGNVKCGYDGSLHFFKMNRVIQDVDFRMRNEECAYFSFLQGGKLQTVALSAPAKDLVHSLRK